MNFSELKQELADRGFAYLSDARLGRYVNWACAELDEMFLWPYREASVTGASPLTISDLGQVEAVIDLNTDQRLMRMDYRSLLDMYGDLSATGSPVYWYRATPSGVPEVATFPVGSSIGVQYWRASPELTGTDTPAAPSRFHGLIVDIAVRRACRDADRHQDAEALSVEIDRQLSVMVSALLVDQGQAWVPPVGDDW